MSRQRGTPKHTAVATKASAGLHGLSGTGRALQSGPELGQGDQVLCPTHVPILGMAHDPRAGTSLAESLPHKGTVSVGDPASPQQKWVGVLGQVGSLPGPSGSSAELHCTLGPRRQRPELGTQSAHSMAGHAVSPQHGRPGGPAQAQLTQVTQAHPQEH